MNLNFINILIIIGLLIIFWEYKLWKNNFLYLLFSFFIVFFIILNNDLWNINLFNLSIWKLLFILGISFSFIIILELIKEKTFDVYCLLFLVFIGSFILIISDNLIILYLGLELQTFSIFILIAKNRYSVKSSEAGLKYFMLGALSSGFYLLSLVLLFLNGYNLDFKDIILFNKDVIVIISMTLILMSFSFKLSLFPFHFWIPDIYEGSSWDVLTLIATLPKISMICVIIQFFINTNLLLTLSLLSIVIGTLGALNQTKLKRLLAYSGVSHMGFIILGYNIICNSSYVVGGLYLTIYMLTMLSILILIINSKIKNTYIIELSSLKFFNSVLTFTLILLILSIAGIPPLSGFISKWYLIWICIENNYNFSSFIIILFSAIGIGYYLRIVKTVYFQKKGSYFVWERVLKNNNSNKDYTYLFLGILFFITIFLIFNFNFLVDLLNYLFITIY